VEKVKSAFENLSLSMRFVLPALAIAYFYAYQGDMRSIKESIIDIKVNQSQNIADVKSSQSQIWKSLNDLKDSTNAQFITIYQRLK
jgi:N-methylhydantoinase B/oxoprolinase/acetone carboxylase alpha subunit